MRAFLYSIFLVLVVSCNKDTPPAKPLYTSAAGAWTYTTPDGKISVDFTLVTSPSGSLAIVAPSIKIDGTLANAVATMDGVNLPDIAIIRISANDASVTYPYPITFTTTTVSSDFSKIVAADVVYQYPNTNNNTLTAQTITRKT